MIWPKSNLRAQGVGFLPNTADGDGRLCNVGCQDDLAIALGRGVKHLAHGEAGRRGAGKQARP